jgi:hypothetical protein
MKTNSYTKVSAPISLKQWRLFISWCKSTQPPEALITIAAPSSFKGGTEQN